MHAYCFRSGEIEFGEEVPEGGISVLEGDDAKVRARVEVRPRWAYDNKTLLVPGIPEANTDEEAEDALFRFKNWVARGPSVKESNDASS